MKDVCHNEGREDICDDGDELLRIKAMKEMDST